MEAKVSFVATHSLAPAAVALAPRQSFVSGSSLGYSRFMQLAIELPAAQAEKLRQEAERFGVAPHELARGAVPGLLAVPDDAFQVAAGRVLRINRELYGRLTG